jgi:hypothetical protein
LGETRSVSKEISPKEKEAWEHFSLDYISKKTVSHFPFPVSLMLLLQNPSLDPSRRRQRKNQYEKVKEEGRTCQERKEQERLYVFWRKEKEILLYKNQKITN